MATDLISNLFGNPHSDSAPSAYSSHRVEEVRKKVLNYLGADEQNFDVIFTANATAAIKLVMESFRDLAATHSSKAPRLGQYWYGYHLDAHTSLIGVRETTNGRHTCFTNDKEVEDWLHGEYVSEELKMASTAEGRLGLFAYPGQSNMTGRRLPLDWSVQYQLFRHRSDHAKSRTGVVDSEHRGEVIQSTRCLTHQRCARPPHPISVTLLLPPTSHACPSTKFSGYLTS